MSKDAASAKIIIGLCRFVVPAIWLKAPPIMSVSRIECLQELCRENFAVRRSARVGSSSPRVMSYQMDFTPEAYKRMNLKLILSEEV